MVVQTYNPSSWECVTGGLSSEPAGLYRDETLSEQAEVADYRLREEHMRSLLNLRSWAQSPASRVGRSKGAFMLHVFFTGDSIYYMSLLYVRQKAIWSMLQVSLSKILAKCHLVPNILLDAGNEGKLRTQRPYTVGV